MTLILIICIEILAFLEILTTLSQVVRKDNKKHTALSQRLLPKSYFVTLMKTSMFTGCFRNHIIKMVSNGWFETSRPLENG